VTSFIKNEKGSIDKVVRAVGSEPWFTLLKCKLDEPLEDITVGNIVVPNWACACNEPRMVGKLGLVIREYDNWCLVSFADSKNPVSTYRKEDLILITGYETITKEEIELRMKQRMVSEKNTKKN